MIRLNSEEQGLLADLEVLLVEAEPSAESLPTVLGALRDALKGERAVAYGVDVGPERYHASYSHCVGFPIPAPTVHGTLEGSMSAVGDPWGWFDPARPEPAQRNRALHFRSLAETEARQMPLHDLPAGEVGRRLGLSEGELETVRERALTRSGRGVPAARRGEHGVAAHAGVRRPVVLGWWASAARA
ncbi:helix-turn-helix transcriptional regulator, partial [Pyxidicoccus sp. 3LG]